MKKYNFLAFDIGATSGRAVLGIWENKHFEMKEVHRFPNAIMELHGKYYWNIYKIYEALKEALCICSKEGYKIDSIGIDTWGVDFGYIAKDGSLLGLPRAYRDPYTLGALEDFFKKVPANEVYGLTGIQFMNFNSLFQLFRANEERFAPLEAAEQILFIPDLLAYLLTGSCVCEYTEASTSQFLNPKTKKIESSLLVAAGVSPSLVPSLVMPGTKIGELTEALTEETGVGKIPVIAVASHDTASAVTAVPAENPRFAYLSSGTWSLMGIETEEPIITEESYKNNFTNEGGIEGTTRFLKNITGMWLLEQCRKEWEKAGREYDYPQIVSLAKAAQGFKTTVNPDDPCFAAPASMTTAITDYCKEHGLTPPSSDSEFVYCIFRSLAVRYKEILELLKGMASFEIDKLHVIGGGSKNDLLNQMTADEIGIPVVAGPSEATAIGNCLVQAKAAGLVEDRWAMRQIIAEAFPPRIFTPNK
ncbi:rhamnulokinase family protein [Massilibacteroides sp.]|uniref:rhamnulokinase n=1 Tax=Massilibacteroides sp. TaxID=2034766 RepID=UPI002635FB80|nr:rhamnulokinase family protein [Massilibacteroides sp.]MDD4515227.1 rhamnulokinase [Massilibacteroides sp.]